MQEVKVKEKKYCENKMKGKQINQSSSGKKVIKEKKKCQEPGVYL